MWLVFMNFKAFPVASHAVISHHQSAVRPCWPVTSELSPWWPSDPPEKLQKLGVEVASREGMECSVLELNRAAQPNHRTVQDHTCTWDDTRLCLFLLRTDIFILLICKNHYACLIETFGWRSERYIAIYSLLWWWMVQFAFSGSICLAGYLLHTHLQSCFNDSETIHSKMYRSYCVKKESSSEKWLNWEMIGDWEKLVNCLGRKWMDY